jgi:hypothetical protein
MPSGIINRVAKECGIDLEEVEKWWKQSKKEVESQGKSKNDQDYWPLVVSLTKKKAGEVCRKKLGWESRAHSLLVRSMTDELMSEEDKGE